MNILIKLLIIFLCLSVATPLRASASMPLAPEKSTPGAPTSTPTGGQVSTPSNSSTSSPTPSPDGTPGATPHPASEGMSPRDLELWRKSTLLGVPFKLLRDGVGGFEMIYARRYQDADLEFLRLRNEWPESPVGPFGQAVLAQARMAENLDFRYEGAFTEAYAVTLERANLALKRGEAKAWHLFLRGTVMGLNSFFLYRKDRLLAAIKDGWSAVSDMEEAQKLTPEFVDPVMGLGLYNFWRSSVTLQFKDLPGFPDKRLEGIEQMKIARDKGLFAPPIARMSLAFSYFDMRKYDPALKETQAIQSIYPNNVINLLIMGQVQTKRRAFPEAAEAYRKITRIDPTNVLVHFYLGSLQLYRLKDLPGARISLAKVAAAMPGTYYGELGRTRLGDACWLMGDKAEAEKHWQTAHTNMPSLKTPKLRLEGHRPTLPRSTSPSSKPGPGSAPGAPMVRPVPKPVP